MKTVSILKLAEQLAAQAPDGWTATHGEGYYDMDGDGPWTKAHPWNPNVPEEGNCAFARFERTVGDVAAVIALRVKPRGKYDRNIHRGRVVEGDTFVNGGSFTRRGIDCESVALVDDAELDDPANRFEHDYADVASMLAGEWTRCEQAVAKRKTSEPVPGTPFSVQPAWFAKTAALLRSGRSVSLTPHGFGTGYTLSRGPVNARRDFGYARAPQELETRLGCGPVWISTFDAD